YSEEVHANHMAGRDWAESEDGYLRARLDFADVTPGELRCLLGAIRARRWAVFTIDDLTCAHLRLDPPPGWRHMRTGVGEKPGAAPQFSGDRPGMGWEPVMVMHRQGGRARWNGGGRHALWKYPAERSGHPTAKPLGLYR